ncbi:A/G-specific adenine glycosylase [Candidatus Woesearchaeota archaeon]|jgi:A/G-specific adenine glycosylase|nr:A/G-specific adenine glycosylase [Candidatus Woesearchaeota archaeon]MBT5396933.1 A/G-specific adenine glycosylase [Candidatus Woesearchaeota archaeon]MBT6367126.1 A/G-specific adenine glycosylase [Candidatus Woesearchaeota archaeon]MBT7762300.1 A/G-specific adenine glycosylase [Candidatus Woesearchaeota archaeon]
MIQFGNMILQWYTKYKRDLPWRTKPINPYGVVISEFMLQQTQVPRVIEKFHEFMRLFPTITDLAHASKSDIIRAWSGLGYNRRALLLHKFAQEVCEKYDGIIPQLSKELIALSGIGPYTAGSIASFAFNKSEPAIDVNVRRIYMRYFHGRDQGAPMGKKQEKELYDLVKKTIPNQKSCDFHNALMDFGSLLCRRKKPLCPQCPLTKSCTFYPLYDKKKDNVLHIVKKKQEKGVIENGKHVPNRIFRGRIVEFVRNNDGKAFTITTLGKVIKKDYSVKERLWVMMLVQNLERDGLIHITKKDAKLQLRLQN